MNTSLSEGEPSRRDALQYTTPSPQPNLTEQLSANWQRIRTICQKIEANAVLSDDEEYLFTQLERQGIYLDLMTLPDLDAMVSASIRNPG